MQNLTAYQAESRIFCPLTPAGNLVINQGIIVTSDHELPINVVY